MDLTEFQNRQKRTAAEPTPEVFVRVSAAIETIADLMEEITADGELMDEIKKYAWYGKNSSGFAVHRAKAIAERTTIPESITASQAQLLRILHGVVGIVTELPELWDALIPAVQWLKHGDPTLPLESVVDLTNVNEELFDAAWYVSEGVTEPLDVVVERGLNKLETRYGKSFDERRAVERDLDAERVQLEGRR